MYIKTYIALQALRLLLRLERHKSVSFTHARPVHDDLRRLDVAVRRKHSTQLRLGRITAATKTKNISKIN